MFRTANSMTPKRLLGAACLAIVLLASGCGSGSNEANGTAATGEGIERSELSEAENDVLDDIIIAVNAIRESPDLWDGYASSDLPSIVPLLDDNGTPTENGDFTSAFAFFHPNPEDAGDAVPVLGIDELPDLHYIPQLVDITKPGKLSFLVDEDIGGTSTFVIPRYEEVGAAWPAVFIHEGFHVFQFAEWTLPLDADQQLYDLSIENYEMALLEDKALVAAYQADGDESTEAIRHFLALRATRLEQFPTVALDGQQEAIEGGAEWFEWNHRQLSFTDEPWKNPNSGDLSNAAEFAQFYAIDFAGVAPLQRFYHTGATQMALLDRMDIDWQARLGEGAEPAELLAEVVVVDSADHESLVLAARESYDPNGELLAVVDVWLTADPGAAGELTVGEDPEVNLWVDAPDEVLSCIAGFGLTPEELDANPALVTTDVSDACLSSVTDETFDEDVFAELDACLKSVGIDEGVGVFDSGETLGEEALICLEQ